MGKLVQLEVFNFKSYRGHHVLLFGDSYFTSIIGPNGSGKSNSMDAISFALGIKSSHLRSTNLKDLIYRGRVIKAAKINADGEAVENGDANGDAPENGDSQTTSQRNDPKFAWVKAVFEDDADQRHEWKRTINSAGQSEYRINDRVVSAKDYIDALEEQSILIKARNFLVFQGDVEKVASQDPKALTRLVEQISGSLEYKAEYERLKAESDEAGDNQLQQLTQRRQINQELNTYRAQKEEAEEYEKKVEERDQAIVKHVLWKLFHFQKTIQESSDEIAKHQEELKEHKRGVEKYAQRLEDARQEQAKVSRQVNKTDKNIREKEKEIEDAENEIVPVDEKIQIATNNLNKFAQREAALTKERDQQDKAVQKLRKDLAEVDKAKKKWEDEFKAAAQQEGRELSEQDLQEYNQLRADVTRQTHAAQIEINTLERQIRTDEASAENLKQKLAELETSVQKLEIEITELQNRQSELKTQSKEAEKERASKQQALNKIQSDRNNAKRRREEEDQNLQDTLRKLQEYQNVKRQSDRERQMREVVAQMKRAHGSSVIGRVVESCSPTQKKYETAVLTMLGQQADAIIVDTERVAKECIQWLKQLEKGFFDFIPLDTITTKPVNSNLKGMHKGMRLGIDCLKYDDRVRRAMDSVCGNDMICDDLKIAKYLCYEKKVNARAVTLDGTVIAKGGNMTGGRTHTDNRSKFSDIQADNLEKLKDKQLATLAALPRTDRKFPGEEELENEINSLEYQIASAREEIKALDRNIDDKRKALDFTKRQLRDQRPKYQEAAQRLQNRQNALKRHRDSVNSVADRVFAAFCQRVGYANIREYEAQQGTVQQEAAEERLKFNTQRSRVANTLSFHEQQLKATDQRLAEMREKAKRDEAMIKELEAEKEEMQEKLDVLNAELETLRESRDNLGEKLSERQAAVNEQRRELDTRSGSVKDVMRLVDGLEADIKRTAASRYTLLRKCRVEEIAIPLADGSATLHQLPMDNQGGQDPDAMDVDEDPEDLTQIEQPEINDYGIEVDFDSLDDELKETEEDAFQATERTLQDAVSSLSSEIDKSNPNHRAKDRLAAAEEKSDAQKKELEKIRKDSNRKKDAFEAVKAKRTELFNKAYEHISENIGGTYKDLTKSAAFPLGGQAYLDQEDTTEPYLAGLKYHAMPPLKRFRDMEHLSGGEKTIAALALLFAIHSYQPSPFFVLDEVDAALDPVNIGRVANYVKNHAQPGMQFIVISLKAGLYQESESLVGVMRDQSKMSSRVVSLDLRKYHDNPTPA